ncbi:MAG: PhzF family phenazine biosynthesis protein [Thermoplasmatota archaeon]
MPLPVYIVDAFTRRSFAGNPAGVVPRADGLSSETMQHIAGELRCSETAFIMDSHTADVRVRFFSPVREVDLCGHATVAAFHVLAAATGLASKVTMETRAGVMSVEIRGGPDGAVHMQQASPRFRSGDVNPAALAAALGVDEAAIADVPAEAASTGLWSLYVPLVSRAAMRRLRPDYDAIEAICGECDVGALFVFTFDTICEENFVHGRCFAPCYGISEDPVTGTANGALGALLRRHGLLEARRYTAAKPLPRIPPKHTT